MIAGAWNGLIPLYESMGYNLLLLLLLLLPLLLLQLHVERGGGLIRVSLLEDDRLLCCVECLLCVSLVG